MLFTNNYLAAGLLFIDAIVAWRQRERDAVRSIGSIMDENSGIGPGFDMLRVGLALAVILRHCFPISYGVNEATGGFVWGASMAIVPMFFTLSGFLVTGSALRLTLGKFALSRILRIVPALVVDTLVTILLIGPIFTSHTLADYFTSPTTHAYLLNIVGEIHYFLPGVFEQNPIHGVVNGALWTVPPELGCYAAMSLLIALGWVHRWHLVAGLFVALVAAIVVVGQMDGSNAIISKIFRHPGAMLVPYFLLGAVLFLRRHSVPYSAPMFGVCLLLILAAGVIVPKAVFSEVPVITVIAAPVYAYATLFIGATKLPAMPFFSRGDYSYGMYLYGFPIQQAIVSLTGVNQPLNLFALTLPPVIGLAMLSWHLVEKPTLRLRKAFSMAAKIEAQRQNGSSG